MIPTVFIVGPVEAELIAEMYMTEGWYVGETVRGADLVQFTGGHDITPMSYGQRPHHTTWSWPNRDVYEWLIYDMCLREGIPMAGICRGGQLLNVINGGSMWQDVDGHTIIGMHWADCTVGGDKLQVTSAHHQMMRPSKNADILMTAQVSTFKERMGKNGIIKVMQAGLFQPVRSGDKDDIEACYYSDTQSLCFQPHPEYKYVAGVGVCRNRYFNYLEHLFALRA